METSKPLKRHVALQALSHDHHDGLMLCWKIRTGFTKKVELTRIKNYIDWFYTTRLLPHFDWEEKHLFNLLDRENELIKKALSDHRRLKRLFENQKDIKRSLGLIEEELEAHIRFEERILFEKIQRTVPTDDLVKLVEQQELVKPTTRLSWDWDDEFWKVK